MEQKELKKLQLTQLKIMDLIHEFCVKNDIKYYMIGGTLLGSIRHKGFIPWDLDIDIAMLRTDYDKFKKISHQLPACLEYHYYGNFKKYSRPHCEVALKNTMIHARSDKYNKKTYYNGIFIDIFPLDYLPSDNKNLIKQEQQIKKIRRLLNLKDGTIYEKKNLFYILGKKIVSFCLKPLSYKFLGKKLEKVMTKFNNYNSNKVCSMASKYSYKKQSMPLDYYGEPILLEFEGRKYYGPNKYVEYLTQLFGDYMKLPPKEAQKSEMDFFDYVDYCYIVKKYEVGYTTGVFDMFHIGHLNILKNSKRYCKKLIVGVTTDELSFERKNKYPIIKFEDRCEIVLSNKYVDKVIAQKDMDKLKAVREQNANVVFVGSDWQWTPSWMKYEEDLKKINVDVVYLDHTDGISSTILRGKLDNGEK